MSDTPQNAEKTSSQRAPSARGHIAGMIALVALFVVVAAWFWSTHQEPPKGVEAGLGMPHGVMVVGAGAFIAALISRIQSLSVSDVLEAVWELLLGMLAAVGMIFKGIWSWFLGLLGWD